MAEIVNAYTLNGSYEYGPFARIVGGTMQGTAVRFGDGKLVGLMTDKDPSDPLFVKGFHRYIWGSFHRFGLSFLKFDSLQTNQSPIYWAFEKNGGEYVGGWKPLKFSRFALMLKATPSLQAVAALDPDSEMLSAYEHEFAEVLTEARTERRVGRLKLSEAPLDVVRAELGL